MTEGKITGKIWHEDKDNHLTHIIVFKDDELVKHMKTDKLEYTIDGLEAGEKYYLIMGSFPNRSCDVTQEVVAVDEANSYIMKDSSD